MRTLMLLCLPLVLTACAASTVVEPPPSLTAACTPPATLPERDLTRGEVELAWGRDRRSLRDCVERHASMVAFGTGNPAGRQLSTATE